MLCWLAVFFTGSKAGIIAALFVPATIIAIDWFFEGRMVLWKLVLAIFAGVGGVIALFLYTICWWKVIFITRLMKHSVHERLSGHLLQNHF